MSNGSVHGGKASKGLQNLARFKARQVARLGGMRVPLEQVSSYRRLQEIGAATVVAEPGGRWFRVALTNQGQELAR